MSFDIDQPRRYKLRGARERYFGSMFTVIVPVATYLDPDSQFDLAYNSGRPRIEQQDNTLAHVALFPVSLPIVLGNPGEPRFHFHPVKYRLRALRALIGGAGHAGVPTNKMRIRLLADQFGGGGMVQIGGTATDPAASAGALNAERTITRAYTGAIEIAEDANYYIELRNEHGTSAAAGYTYGFRLDLELDVGPQYIDGDQI